MSFPSTLGNITMHSLFPRHGLPPDEEGPILSVGSIIAIVTAILLAVATVAAVFFFVRTRSRARNPSAGAVAGLQISGSRTPHPDIELASFSRPIPIVPSSRSSTYDQGVPPYDPRSLPEYYEKPPPSPSPSRPS